MVLASREEAADGRAAGGGCWSERGDGDAGDAGDVAAAAGGGLGGDAAAEGAVRRRGAAARSWPSGCCARGGALWNLYGPTETTIWSTVGAGASRAASRSPIGRPIANTAGLRARRAAASRCRSGVPGELYIGGDGLARGYLGPAGADGGAVRARSVRRRAGRAAVPHRRPGALPRRTARSSSWAASTTR